MCATQYELTRATSYRRWSGPLEPAEYELCDDLPGDLHDRRRPAAGRHVGQPDGHLPAAVRAPELHGEFLVHRPRNAAKAFRMLRA